MKTERIPKSFTDVTDLPSIKYIDYLENNHSFKSSLRRKTKNG